MQRRTKLILLAVIAAVLVGLLLWQENRIATLRARNQTLAAQVQAPDSPQVGSSESAAHANDAATQAATDRSELERLRAQAESMRTQLQAAQTARVAIARSAATTPGMNRGPLPPGYISLLDAQDVGAATGGAMMQTFIWAMRTADTNRIAALVDASAEGAQKSLEQMLSSLPGAAERGEFERSGANIAFQPVREVPLPDGDTALVVDASGPDGKLERKAVRIRRSGNEWHLVLGKQGPEEIKLTPEQMGD